MLRRRVDDFLRLVGIAQGAHFLWATVGAGALVAGLVGGALAFYLALDWWAIALTTFGAFVLAAGGVSQAIAWRQSRTRSTPLSAVIDAGVALRQRLLDDPAEDVTPEQLSAWRVRVEDWIAEARRVVNEIAPDRLRAFQLDVIIADTGPEAPKWKYNLLLELDLTLERLRVLRASV